MDNEQDYISNSAQPTKQPTPDSTATPTLEPTPTLFIDDSGQTTLPAGDEEVVLATPAAAISGKLPHYDLSVNLDYYCHQAQVEENVTVTNHSPDSWSEVVLNVSNAYWPGKFTLASLEVIQDGVAQEATPRLEETMLHVDLPSSADPGQMVAINMAYRLNLPTLDPFGWGPTSNTGWGQT